LTLGQAGWLASANYVGYLLGALNAVFLRVRPELMIRAGLVTVGIATAAMGLTHVFLAWASLRLLAGISSAWVLIGVSAWCIERLTAYQRPLLSSLVFSGVGTGIAATGLACIGLTQRNAGSAAMWIWLGLASLGVTALVWRTFSVTRAASTTDNQAGTGAFHWHADAIRLVCCYGIFGFGYIIPATFLPVMAKNALHDSAVSMWSWPVFGFAAAGATLGVAVLRRRISDRRLWAASQWIMATGILLPVVWSHVLAIFAAALLVGATFMVITLVALQEAKPVAGKHASVLIAAMTCAFAIGQIIGPLTISTGGDGRDGFSMGLTVAAVLLAGSTFLLRRNASASLHPD
jgi:MFS family permease